MITIHYPDGSEGYRYENGDLVTLTRNHDRALLHYKAGDWGAVQLKDREDRKRGFTNSISFVNVQTAGVSTSKDSFSQRMVSIPVWDLKPRAPYRIITTEGN